MPKSREVRPTVALSLAPVWRSVQRLGARFHAEGTSNNGWTPPKGSVVGVTLPVEATVERGIGATYAKTVDFGGKKMDNAACLAVMTFTKGINRR